MGSKNWWTRLFSLLAPPMQVNMTHGTLATSLFFSRYLDCRGMLPIDRSNTSCQEDAVLLCHLALDYVVMPYNASFPKCNSPVAFRDAKFSVRW